MWAKYEDITSRLGNPLWHDEHGVPRYDQFTRELVADIYAREIALVEIQCQACLKRFDVAFSYAPMQQVSNPNLPSLSEEVTDDTLHYGDPPRHDDPGGHGCAGETMNCNDLRVLQFWQMNQEYDWKRIPRLELRLEREENEVKEWPVDTLEGKHKKQAPVDRRLVEEALEVAVREQKPWPTALWPASRFGEIVRLLRLALEGDSDA